MTILFLFVFWKKKNIVAADFYNDGRVAHDLVEYGTDPRRKFKFQTTFLLNTQLSSRFPFVLSCFFFFFKKKNVIYKNLEINSLLLFVFFFNNNKWWESFYSSTFLQIINWTFFSLSVCCLIVNRMRSLHERNILQSIVKLKMVWDILGERQLTPISGKKMMKRFRLNSDRVLTAWQIVSAPPSQRDLFVVAVKYSCKLKETLSRPRKQGNTVCFLPIDFTLLRLTT